MELAASQHERGGPMTPDNLRDVLAEVIQPAFDEWLFRMHGVVSSCGHETEAEGIADALAPTVERLIADARAEGRALGRFETTTGHKPEPRDPNYQAGYSRGCADQAAADRARVEALAAKWETEGITCRCGHYAGHDHNSRGCYAVVTYSPLVRCACPLTDAQSEDELAAEALRAALDSEGGTP
jgi:hypothetical protein